jgi:hypothetical protein
MSNKQTAVDFFLKEMSDIIGIVNTDAFQNLLMVDAYNKAKQMEKEQIKDAFTDGCIGELYELNAYYTSEKYYNKTYNVKDI